MYGDLVDESPFQALAGEVGAEYLDISTFLPAAAFLAVAIAALMSPNRKLTAGSGAVRGGG